MSTLTLLTTSIFSKTMVTPPAVPQGMFVTVSVCNVTYDIIFKKKKKYLREMM